MNAKHSISNIRHRTRTIESAGRERVFQGSTFRVQGSGLPAWPQRAFTLIELLVVITIIGVLAALLFPAGAAVKRKATIKRVEGELGQLENAIASYKTDKAFYPPDNSANSVANGDPDDRRLYFNVDTSASVNSLYYELTGAQVVNASNPKNLVYETLGSDQQVTTADLKSAFGVGGIMNANVGGRNVEAKNYIKDFKPTQSSHSDDYSDLKALNLPAPGVMVVSTIVKGPLNPGSGPSRFCYVTSSKWQRNPETFDLWVDIIVGSKTNRISNWTDEPETISY